MDSKGRVSGVEVVVEVAGQGLLARKVTLGLVRACDVWAPEEGGWAAGGS